MPNKRRYESSLERDLMELVRDEPDYDRLDDQPIIIPYGPKGTQTYTVDAFVLWKSNERPWLVEVKYREAFDGQWRDFKPKFRAARDYAKERGWQFLVLTECHIRTQRLKNVRFLHEYGTRPAVPEVEKKILKLLKAQPLPAKEVVRAVNVRGVDIPSVISILWRMVAKRQLSIDWDKPITMATQISLAS